MKNHLLLFSLLASGLAYGQQTETREAKTFSTLSLEGAVMVEYTDSAAFSIKVSASAEDLKHVETSFSGDRLMIRTSGHLTGDVKIYVTGNRLEALHISGATHFHARNNLHPKKAFQLAALGASKVNLNLSTQHLDVTANGAAEVILNGTVADMQVNISGAASLKAAGLSSDDTDVDASGAASAKVVANKKLHAKSSGAASVRYTGTPTDISTDVRSAASIRKAE